MSELLSIAIPNRQMKRMYARLAHVLIWSILVVLVSGLLKTAVEVALFGRLLTVSSFYGALVVN